MDNSEISKAERYQVLATETEEVRQDSQWVHPTGGAPRTVDVVALGYSLQTYMHQQLRKGLDPDSTSPGHEVWTLNRGIRLIEADLAFILDELPDEIRDDPAYGKAIECYEKPIISTVCSPTGGTCSVYPAPYILDCLRTTHGMRHLDPYWHNSLPMILAYALCIGVEEITLWGCDYQSQGGVSLEDDRANCEYWIGYCRARGMRVGCPVASTLMNSSKTNGQVQVYGLRDQRNARAFLGLGESMAERLAGEAGE